MVDSLNAISDRYKRAGFREVYLNIIPNKVTMLEPQRGTYNHLIERIQNHPALRVPVIDTYGTYRRLPRPPYLKSDTHWDCSGRAIWLKQVREKLGV